MKNGNTKNIIEPTHGLFYVIAKIFSFESLMA
jgi:hypothetical protein